MRLVPIVDRLKEQGFKRVQGVLELISLKSAPHLPAYYVVPDEESAGQNQLTTPGAHSQLTDTRFGVVIMVEGGGANQHTASDQLAELQDKVIAALLGWSHPEAAASCDYAGSGMLNLGGSTLSWVVRFRTKRLIRKVPS